MRIPFLNLTLQNQALKQEITSVINTVLVEGPLVGGDYVRTFEKKFADYHGVKHCIATGNGTDSLFAAMKMLGIGAGDEVITPAWSWISTSETISLTGAKPVFADVDGNSCTLSIQDVEQKITKNTKAILAVNLYGQCCNMAVLQKICSEHKIKLIEDCAQAHGAKQHGKMAGTFSDIASFSFYPTKNLGAIGDAGCLLTHDDAFAIKLRRFVNHGGLSKDEHVFEGMNSRMDSIQAAVLNVKLTHLKEWNTRRRAIAYQYIESLSGLNTIQSSQTLQGNEHVFHLFVIQSSKRDLLKKYLLDHGIETMLHYPKALPFEPAYHNRAYKAEDFPVSSRLQNEVLSLPCHPFLTDDEVAYICAVIRKFEAT